MSVADLGTLNVVAVAALLIAQGGEFALGFEQLLA
jgi:hypothetical protein